MSQHLAAPKRAGDRRIAGHARSLRRKAAGPALLPALVAVVALVPVGSFVGVVAPGAGGRLARAADVGAATERIDAAVIARLQALGGAARHVADAEGRLTEVVVTDGSQLTAEDLALLGGLEHLRVLQIFDCRTLDDAAAGALTDSGTVTVLALTNAALTDDGVKAIVANCRGLVELDLSSNTNLTGSAMRAIAELDRLERLTLVQTRFNDLALRRLAKLEGLRALDLRGNMEAGDLTLEVVGRLPRVTGFKHRSTVVTDVGIAGMTASDTLRSLLLQDFAITDAAGEQLARLAGLDSLEIFRCQGFGTEGVKALAGLPLTRLTLRDLPDVRDAALEVLGSLPNLQRLYLHELPSVGDGGLRQLAAARSLRVLDVWSVPGMTDATLEVIAGLPALEELSIRETGVSDAAIARILAMPKLTSLTFKDNGALSADAVSALAGRRWKKLDLGADTPAASR